MSCPCCNFVLEAPESDEDFCVCGNCGEPLLPCLFCEEWILGGDECNCPDVRGKGHSKVYEEIDEG
jgi:hypothetical protein